MALEVPSGHGGGRHALLPCIAQGACTHFFSVSRLTLPPCRPSPLSLHPPAAEAVTALRTRPQQPQLRTCSGCCSRHPSCGPPTTCAVGQRVSHPCGQGGACLAAAWGATLLAWRAWCGLPRPSSLNKRCTLPAGPPLKGRRPRVSAPAATRRRLPARPASPAPAWLALPTCRHNLPCRPQLHPAAGAVVPPCSGRRQGPWHRLLWLLLPRLSETRGAGASQPGGRTPRVQPGEGWVQASA